MPRANRLTPRLECSTYVLMDAADPRPTSDAETISDLVACAYALGKAAFAIAQSCGKADHKGFFAASAEFRHCFFAVRMGIRLKLVLGAAAAEPVAERPEAEASETERLDADLPARERTRDERDREREGDYERVSLPAFLKSLRGVAAAAERRKAELPAELVNHTLPRLHALLAKAGAGPPAAAPPAPAPGGVALLARPRGPQPPDPRSRLLGSAAPPRGPPRRHSG